MEELGLEYKLELFQPETSNGSAPDALRRFTRWQSAGDRDGDAVLAESGAIVDYIVHRYAAIVSPWRLRLRLTRATSTGSFAEGS